MCLRVQMYSTVKGGHGGGAASAHEMLTNPSDQGYKQTLQENKNYLAGLNVFKGKVTFKGVADAFKLSYTPPEQALTE